MLQLINIEKNYKGFALRNINMIIEKGDYFVLLGNSGAGKSLLLELIIGIEKQNKGQIVLNNEDVSKRSIQNRALGIVFQDLALFPHKTVKENICFPIKKQVPNKLERNRMINEISNSLNIIHLLKRYPHNLSGGELQRVALARTLILKPEVLLLDEPLSSLDVQLKSDLRSLLRKINQNGQTVIHVTHDYDEAIALGNKVAVIDRGELIQCGDIEGVFRKPASAFVANFMGIKNFFKAEICANNKHYAACVSDQIKIELLCKDVGSIGFVMIRSEDIFISLEKLDSSAVNNFEAVILEANPDRQGIEILVDIGIKLFILITKESFKRMNLSSGKKIWISFKASAVQFLKV